MAGVAGAASEIADAAGCAALDPEDGVGVLRFQQELQVGRDVGGALAQAGGFVHILQALQFAFETSEGVERAGVGVAALFQEIGALFEGHAAEAVPLQVRRRAGKARRRRVVRGRAGLRSRFRWLRWKRRLARSMVSTSRASSSKRWVLRPMPKKLLAVSSSSCASSKMTAPAAGSTPASAAAPACSLIAMSAKNRWWLTMMRSDSSALRRIAVMKQLSQSGQVWPRQASPRASSLGQSAEFSGSASISARSPVAVVFSHAAMAWNCEISSRPGEQRRIAQRVQLVLAQVVAAALHVADLERAEDAIRGKGRP